MTPRGLSDRTEPRQAEVLRLVDIALRERGAAPLLRELGEALGVSRQAAQQLVAKLVERGLLEPTSAATRGLRLTPSGAAWALADCEERAALGRAMRERGAA